MNPLNKWLLSTIVAGSLAFTGAQLWEGKKNDVYLDLVNVVTVCYGYTGKDIIKTKRYTDAECNSLLSKELYTHAVGMLSCVDVPLKEHEFHAFLLFTYNVGVNAFCKSNSVAVPLNNGHIGQACMGMKRWVYAGGKYVQGLANRREYEYNMCIGKMNGPVKTNFDGYLRSYSDAHGEWLRIEPLYRKQDLHSYYFLNKTVRS